MSTRASIVGMRPLLLAFAVVLLAVASACGGDDSAEPAAASPSPSPSPSPSAVPTVDPQGELCQRVGEVESRLATLRRVELVLENRTLLEIELDKLQAAHTELERAELGEREDELEDSLTRLGYRRGELKLAVEDFRTINQIRRTSAHVEEDSQKVVNELNAFVVLSGC